VSGENSSATWWPRGVASVLVACVLVVGWATTTQRATSTLRASSHAASSHRAAIAHAPPSPAVKSESSASPVGSLVAWAKVGSLPIWSQPGGTAVQSLANPNNLGAPLVLLVNSTKQRWIQVYLPQRPNGSLGWTLSSDVNLVRDPERILVSLSTRSLELFNGSKVLFQTSVAVGSPDSPTPTGYFYVTEVLKLTGPPGAYGPYALGLSGFSNTYMSFDGGPGQIAIHGTDQPWVVGQYASHGCVRLKNPQITVLANQVETGTPVDIVA
jgi:lipoprotein-anchoring transpeptidase ErfK/SrfK